jgi:hypothetical protein
VRKIKLAFAFLATAALSFMITFVATGPSRSVPENSAVDPVYPAAQRQPLPRVEKYRPHLTPDQADNPSNLRQQYELALSAYDRDLVNIARARFSYWNDQLGWLEKAQQQREANNIDWTKPLNYPVQMYSYPGPMNSLPVAQENGDLAGSASTNLPGPATNSPGAATRAVGFRGFSGR